MIRCIWLVPLCGFFLAADNDNDPAATSEYAWFEGVWRFALVEVEGAKQPAVPFATNKMILSKDGSYIVVQGPRITRGTLKLDPTTTPKHYDPTIGTGRLKGATFLGIYDRRDDTFRICFPLRGKERPTEFASKPGNGLMIQVFERQRKDIAEDLIAVARQELTGTWQAVSYARNGEKASDEDMAKIKLAIDASGKATARREGKVFIGGATTVDPTKKPMTIDITYTEGDPKGRTALGIYKVEDDELTICRAAPGEARPTEFASRPGSGHALMTYRRENRAPK